MNTIPTAFRLFVLIAVTLTGGVFGTFAGLIYSRDQFWWAGTITGAASGLVLAWVYLKVLSKLSPDRGKALRWAVGTATAVGCGVVCTVLVHAVMIVPMTVLGHRPDRWEPPDGVLVCNIFWIVVTGALILGAIVGFVLGGICSLVFVFQKKAPT